MKGKILFVAGAAVGYVLGARAGRKRYEQISAAAARIWEAPGIQRQVHQVQDFAAEKVGEIPEALIEGAKKVVSSVVKRPATTAATKASPTKAAPAKTASADEPAAKSAPKRPAATKPAARKPAAKKPTTEDDAE